MWPPTISLTPCGHGAIRAFEVVRQESMASMSPALCASDMRIMSVMNFFKLARKLLDVFVDEGLLAGKFLQWRI